MSNLTPRIFCENIVNVALLKKRKKAIHEKFTTFFPIVELTNFY